MVTRHAKPSLFSINDGCIWLFDLQSLNSDEFQLTKGKKKKQGTTLRVERGEMDTFDDYGGGEYDDFM